MTVSSSNTPNEQLTSARDLVKNIQSALAQISEIGLGLSSHKSIVESLKNSQQAFQLLESKLNQPALRIATIGTTSAGKSTLVNALIGHKVAPMDSAELSAGVLHLKHSPRNRLQVKAIEGFYDGIDKYDLSDADIYQHIREDIFKKYHVEKQERSISVPEIHIEVPLFPAATKGLLGLPEGVDFEVYDLPGLNSINDHENLKVIQSHLQQCFSLVVMDYAHTDKKSRATLLKEVKEVKDALGGKTDAMIFALNRIDRRGKNDDPLELRLRECAEAIQKELNMDELPDIVPISSLPLYYSQCAWGYGDLSNNDSALTTLVDFQESQIKSFQIDCATFIKTYQKENKGVKQWFRDIDDELDELEDGAHLSSELLEPEKLKEWLMWTGEHSGGFDLWKTLKIRISERFSEIVIAPALIDPLRVLQVLLGQLGNYAEMQRLSSKEEIHAKRTELQEQFEELNSFLDDESLKFEEEVKNSVEKLQKAMVEAEEDEINAAIKSLFGIEINEEESEAVANLRSLVESIKNDLIDQIIEAVRSYYLEGLDKQELRGELDKYLPVELAKKLSTAADTYRTQGMGGEAISKGIVREERSDNEKEVNQINKTEKAAHILYKNMRASLSSRTNYLLQVQQSTLQAALQSLLDKGVVATEMRIKAEIPDACETLMAIYQQQLADINVADISEQLFGGQENIEKQEEVKDMGSGYERNTVVDKGSCWDSDKVEVKKKVDMVNHTTLKLPSLDSMIDEWVLGINQSEKELWAIVGNWFSQSAQKQNELFKQSLNKAQEHLQSLLDERLNESEEEYQAKLSLLVQMEGLCKQAEAGQKSLKQIANIDK